MDRAIQNNRSRTTLVLTLMLLSVSALVLLMPGRATADSTANYIVQADTMARAVELVMQVGGRVGEELAIIRAVGADLTPQQLDELRALEAPVKIYENRAVQVRGDVPETWFPSQVGAAELHAQGIDGRGVTIAVLDTGLWEEDGLDENSEGEDRILARHDVILAREFGDDDDDDDDDDADESENDDAEGIDDWSGHGTHVTSVMMSSRKATSGNYMGIAPGAKVVAVRAFGPDGSGQYTDVIRALGWIIWNRHRYNIRVLNLSFSGDVTSAYWDDPLNQAVMLAWQAGIVVVAAAGNAGPDAMTIGVPGNLPYVITVGAVTDNYTPNGPADDYVASFSSTGPTYEGFIKPEVLAPGGHMIGMMPPHGWLWLEYPEGRVADDYFKMSGTSQATAVVSGIAALMLQQSPGLSPNDVKCRIMDTAQQAFADDGLLAYSIFQQGAGLVHAGDALASTATDCANQGMNLIADLWGFQHYGGPAFEDENGNFFLRDPESADPDDVLDGDGSAWSRGSPWTRGYAWTRGRAWTRGSPWTRGGVWSRGRPWTRSEYTWTDGGVETDNVVWSSGLTEPISINGWVGQE